MFNRMVGFGGWCVAVLAMALFVSGCATTSSYKDTSRTFDTVVVDAGHGGHDSGALGYRGIAEKHVALDVAKRVRQNLQAAGLHTVMTRSDDRFIPLGSRVATLNAQPNAIFVSIHFNYSRSRGIRGAETYYNHPAALPLANRIQGGLTTLASNRGVKYARYHVLRNARRPAVLVECGFLTNRSEARQAATAAYREKLARKIADAIIQTRHPGPPLPPAPIQAANPPDATSRRDNEHS